MLGFSATLFAQSRTITGQVKAQDTNEALVGALVFVPNSATGVSTDAFGKYSIQIQNGQDSLAVSLLGYSPQKVAIANRSVIDFSLNAVETEFNEVVEVGYGVQRKSDLTGSVSSLRGKDITKVPAMSPEQALQGKLAGVQVNNASGAPGSVPVVRIRGVGTMNNAAPIYVVDGVILDDISFLSSSDIESMEVLKDASATAIYGSRGANGVVMVSTRRGSGVAGKPQITFTTEMFSLTR
jgi:TonB-dependent SusC/RagA subfamily outer membrane receptor